MTVKSVSTACVWFVGAGPGDPELLTRKAERLLRQADVLVYAGSLVSPEVLALANPGAERHDSAGMNLDETHAVLRRAALAGQACVRLQAGDPSLYGTVREQARLLDQDGIPWKVCPGVSSAFAAAAAAGVGFTVPEATQSLVFTRLSGRTPVPEREALRSLAAHHCSLAVFLSADKADTLAHELRAAGLPGDTTIVVASRVGWPDERLWRTDLDHVADTAHAHGLARQTLYLVLPGEKGQDAASRLYAKEFTHGWRTATPE